MQKEFDLNELISPEYINSPPIGRRNFLKAIGILAACAGSIPLSARPSPGQTLTPVKVTLSFLPSGTFAYLYVAKKLGYWEKRGLSVQIDRGFGSGEAIKNVGLGLYDFGHVDFNTLVISIAKGMDVVAIGSVMAVSPIGLFSLKDKGIKEPKDIEGKIFGTDPGGAVYSLFPAFAKATGIDESKVKVMMLKQDIQTASLLQGTIDFRGSFYTTLAPELWARGYEFNMILYEKYGLKLYGPGLITQKKYLKEKREICAKFVAGAMEGLAYTYLEPDKSADIFIDSVPEYKTSPQGREVVKHGIGTTIALGLVDYVKKQGLGWYDRKLVQDSIDTVTKYMKLDNIPSADTIFSNDFVSNLKLTPEQWKIIEEKAQRYIIK